MTPEQEAVIEKAKEWVYFYKADGGCTSYAGKQLTVAVKALKESEAGQDFAWAWEQARAGRKVHHKSWEIEGLYLAGCKEDAGEVLGRVPTLETIYSDRGWFPGPVPAKTRKGGC